MSEVSRILDQLQRAKHGPAWHGPALDVILANVTAEAASRRPLPQAHSIWEIVLHIGVWMSIAARRIQGDHVPSLTTEQDWPPATGTSETDWRRALGALGEAQEKLEEEVKTLAEERLNQVVMGDTPQSIYVLLHGIVQHNLYHAGQISLLKNAG